MRRQLLTGLHHDRRSDRAARARLPARRVRRRPGSCSRTRPNGSLVKNKDGKVVGSSLIGQDFVDTDGNP